MTEITGIVLAAGPSRRFAGGAAKQLVRIDGEPLVRRTARRALASRLRRVLVVVGHQSATVSAVLAGLAVEVVDNPDFADGQSTSVRAGLSRVDDDAAAAVFLPVDQPFVTPELIDRMIDRFLESGAPVVAPAHAGRRRAPVLIGRDLFERMARITGDEGGRQIFAELDEGEIEEVEVADPRVLEDVDTVADLDRLRGSLVAPGPVPGE